MRHFVPLRYPGGKGKLLPFFAKIMSGLRGRRREYVEPYAGGAGVALGLLLQERASRVHINDASRSIYAFWKAALCDTERFIHLLRSVPLSVAEWERQRAIAAEPSSLSTEVGFAVFYLNRTNRSGIIHTGGVIGGLRQQGKWKIDARFNRAQLEQRIRLVASYRRRIALHNVDAIELLKGLESDLPSSSVLYLDPPYYHKAERLYHRTYDHEDHVRLAEFVRGLGRPWVVTYDLCDEIVDIYDRLPKFSYQLRYSAASKRLGGEVLVHSPGLSVPHALLPGGAHSLPRPRGGVV